MVRDKRALQFIELGRRMENETDERERRKNIND